MSKAPGRSVWRDGMGFDWACNCLSELAEMGEVEHEHGDTVLDTTHAFAIQHSCHYSASSQPGEYVERGFLAGVKALNIYLRAGT